MTTTKTVISPRSLKQIETVGKLVSTITGQDMSVDDTVGLLIKNYEKSLVGISTMLKVVPTARKVTHRRTSKGTVLYYNWTTYDMTPLLTGKFIQLQSGKDIPKGKISAFKSHCYHWAAANGYKCTFNSLNKWVKVRFVKI